MDLAAVERKIVAAAKKHPSRRNVTLRHDSTDQIVNFAIYRQESRRQSGGAGVLIVQTTRFVLLRFFCNVIPQVGDAILDSKTSLTYTIQGVDLTYGGLAYTCTVDMQQ